MKLNVWLIPDELLLDELEELEELLELEELEELLDELDDELLLELEDELLLELELDDELLLLLELEDELLLELEDELLLELDELLELELEELGATYVKLSSRIGSEELSWSVPLMVTTTLLAPAVPAGVVAVIVVPLTTMKLVAATPPMVTPVAKGAGHTPVSVMGVPPLVGPKFGETLASEHWLEGVQTPASAGTAMLVTTGINAAVIVSMRRREIGSSNLGKPRRRRPFCSSSARATRTTSSSSGAPAASWRILAISGTVRLPSASFQTSAAVWFNRCATLVC